MATVRTESYLQNNVFQDGQPEGSITAADMRDFVESAKYLSALGWHFLYDSDYATSGAARTILDGQRTQLTISPNPSEDLRYPPDFPDCWDPITDRLQPFSLNGFGIIRLSLVAWADTPNARFDVEFDISATGTDNTIYDQTSVFAKGTGVGNAQHFNYVIPIFCGQPFVDNGGRFYITPTGSDINIFQTTLTTGMTLVPNPAGPG
jgi:hypothetical protein